MTPRLHGQGFGMKEDVRVYQSHGWYDVVGRFAGSLGVQGQKRPENSVMGEMVGLVSQESPVAEAGVAVVDTKDGSVKGEREYTGCDRRRRHTYCYTGRED